MTGLLISQEKSYSLSFSFLLCSYNIMSKILLNAGLIMKHSKTELFHFMSRTVQSRSGMTRSRAELLQSGRELTTKVGNNLDLSLYAVP